MSFNKNSLVNFIRELYEHKGNIPLHEPFLFGDETKIINRVLEKNLVSTYGEYVTKFENKLKKFIDKKEVIAVNSGTSALHMSLLAAGVKENDYVLTQPLTFVATCNSISYCKAKPIFIDISKEYMSLCPEKLEEWLIKNAKFNKNNKCILKSDNKIISACLFVNIFGHPSQSKKINKICKKWKIKTIEDCAESFGSKYYDKHVGSFSDLFTLSFNGNKIITTGSGGAICTNSKYYSKKIRHISTTARVKSKELYYMHDMVGYNYRLPNLNAALGLSQLSKFEFILKKKYELSDRYNKFFKNTQLSFFQNQSNCLSNYWLNTIVCESSKQRTELLNYTNNKKINTRPGWILMNKLKPYRNNIISNIENSIFLSQRVLNLPSSINFK